MTTDPGDLVFDPTCGSGTTAYVSEQWGRRWITCDTSRVAVALARQRLMTASYDYYELAHPDEGVGSGFKYKTSATHHFGFHRQQSRISEEGMSQTEINSGYRPARAAGDIVRPAPCGHRQKARNRAVQRGGRASPGREAGRRRFGARADARGRLGGALRRVTAPSRMAGRATAHRHPREGGPVHPFRQLGTVAWLTRIEKSPRRRGDAAPTNSAPIQSRVLKTGAPQVRPSA